MLIAVIVLQVLILLVLGYMLWRMPKRMTVVSHFTVGDVASMETVRKAGHQMPPARMPPSPGPEPVL
ncbi:purine-cytosine permease-like protein [Variovorax boronicumulans]|uniref:hypothetical protein n=1 Tax=Variovorax boronicumulans TaxID=436515 RepID=UPI00278792FC|nr:hypothetical protein [Variovorax boronicumulans]MDQ0035916.1 purine-cytosine permease-like protein [Variovorax boronicumulans]